MFLPVFLMRNLVEVKLAVQLDRHLPRRLLKSLANAKDLTGSGASPLDSFVEPPFEGFGPHFALLLILLRYYCCMACLELATLSLGLCRYVWPSLAAIRPGVKFPQYLLASFAVARAYVREPVLRGNLLTITRVAAAHLRDGVKPDVLFGHMHKFDVPKFHEVCTCFHLAAVDVGDHELAGVCSEALDALLAAGGSSQRLHADTVWLHDREAAL
jgi:hypothetical protein